MKITKLNILFVFILLLLTFVSCKSITKYNYSNYQYYQHEDHPEILNYVRLIESNFKAYGSIKSLEIISTDSTGFYRTSDKYIYNKEKEVVRRLRLNNLREIIGDIEYYRYNYYDSESLIKEGYWTNHHGDTIVYSSDNNEILNQIIFKAFENGDCKRIDTVNYEANFNPTIVRYNNNNGIYVSDTKYEYKNNNIVAWINFLPNGNIRGYKKIYDSKNRYIGNYRLKSVNNKSLEYELSKEKRIYFEYKETEFIYRTDAATFTYNYKDRTLERIGNDYSNTITYFSKKLAPIKYIIDIGKYEKTLLFCYNKNDDLISKLYEKPNSYSDSLEFEYVYDNKNNWIKKVSKNNGKIYEVVERLIEYY